VIARSHRKSVYPPRPASRTKCRSLPFISLTIGSPLDTLMPTRVKGAQPACILQENAFAVQSNSSQRRIVS
jgi:hypothetical protein